MSSLTEADIVKAPGSGRYYDKNQRVSIVVSGCIKKSLTSFPIAGQGSPDHFRFRPATSPSLVSKITRARACSVVLAFLLVMLRAKAGSAQISPT